MTPEREKLIRDLWPVAERYGFGHGPIVHVPIRRGVQPPEKSDWEPKPAPEEKLSYELQHGMKYDRPWARVVCEGVVVAEGPA